MALSILNNISSMTAENALSNTQANLQKTLTQLSTGLKINSGSDDAAGLSIAQGMTANIAALTQSQQNASNGIGMLQTADGALSQVTTLLNRAVTLATEGSTSGITSSQSTALNTEFTSILSEINQIGQATNFNGANVFSANTPSVFVSSQGSVAAPLTTATALTAGSVTTIEDAKTGGKFVFKAAADGSSTIASLATAVAAASTGAGATLSAGITASINSSGQLQIGPNTANSGVTVSTNDSVLGGMNATAATAPLVSSLSGLNAAGTDTLSAGSVTTIKDANGATFTYTAGNATDAAHTSTVNDLLAAFTKAVGTTSTPGAGGADATATHGSTVLTGKFALNSTLGMTGSGTTKGLTLSSPDDTGMALSTNDTGLPALIGTMSAAAVTTSNTNTVYIGDGTTTGAANTQITTVISALSSTALNLASNNLNSSADATTALANVTAAINSVSAQRGVIGASVNRLSAASANMSNEVTNLTSAANSIQNADIGKTVANMTQYNVLQSTGMAALQQSNQAQQAVLKLVQ
jgi:flagellin